MESRSDALGPGPAGLACVNSLVPVEGTLQEARHTGYKRPGGLPCGEPVKFLLVPVALALAGAGMTGAVLTGTLPLMKASAPASPEGPQGWDVLKSFEGDVADDVLQGTLELRSFTGNLQVIGWSEPRYAITIYEHREGDGPSLGDGSIEPEFKATDGAEGLALSLKVAQKGTADIKVNSWSELAVIAQVPSRVAWTSALVCSGQVEQFETAFGQLFDTLFSEKRQSDMKPCLEGGSPVSMNMGIGKLGVTKSNESEVADIPFSVEALHGGDLVVQASYASLHLMDLAFDAGSVLTQYGEIRGKHLQVADLAALTEYGGIKMGVAGDNLVLGSQYGNVLVQVTGGDSGKVEVTSQYGDVKVGVPVGPDRGYDATATTQYGEATIDLEDAESGDEDGGAAATSAPGLDGIPLPFGEGKKPSREGHTAQAKTVDFDAKPIQVTITAATQYGDVLITDSELKMKEKPGHA